MRMLFEMDKKDYSACSHAFRRDSSRSIIIRGGRVAMVHSLQYDYYKFPGGGIEAGEDPVTAMIRETREEAGLIVVPETIQEYGMVHRIQKSDTDDTECFVQDNYYYLCEAEEELVAQDLDAYEAKEAYRLEYVEPATAIRKNRHVQESPYSNLMFEREARVLELLQTEGYLKDVAADSAGMDGDERIGMIRAWWNETSDSDWYQSLRTEEQINRLKADPASAFHPAVYELIRKYLPDLKNLRILLPSSGDNHAAFALAILGARVTSADISPRQLEHAADIAKRLRLEMEFVCDDTMKLSRLPDHAFDLVYTSNGTLSWINDLDSMCRNICRVLKPGGYVVLYDMHPFNRPFSGEAFKEPRIVKAYEDVFPDLHWRIQDIVNAQLRSGLTLCEMAELPALDASFWFAYDALRNKRRAELEGIHDWKKNPMAALPAWLTLVSRKADSSPLGTGACF